MVQSQNSTELPSLAGLMALGKYPQQYFPQMMLTFVSYPTESGPNDTSGERFIDNVTLEGPVPIIVRDSLNAIRRNMARRAVVNSYGRQDIWEYPEPALREAIVNALVHRDLSPVSRGTQVQVEMYPDRLVVRSPGGLFGPVTVDSLGEEGVSSSRNATLLKLLEDVPVPGETRTVCEDRGSGIRAMLAALRGAGMSAPRFEDKVSSFVVTFPKYSLISDEVVEWIRSLDQDGLTDSQCIGLAMLRQGWELTNKSYRLATGQDSRVATSELQDLVARKIVLQTGDRRWAKYTLPSRSADHSRNITHRRSSPADRRQELLDTLQDATLSRAELAERTGLTDQTVRRWLSIMRRQGLVELVGGAVQSKKAKYRRVPGRRIPLQGQEPTLFSS